MTRRHSTAKRKKERETQQLRRARGKSTRVAAVPIPQEVANQPEWLIKIIQLGSIIACFFGLYDYLTTHQPIVSISIVLLAFCVLLASTRVVREWLVSLVRSLRSRVPTRIALITCVIVILGSALFIHRIATQTNESSDDFTVAVANYEAPGQRDYGLTDMLERRLRQAADSAAHMRIVSLNQYISEKTGGSSRARELGRAAGADIVLWGYYTPTVSSVALTLYIERMSVRISSLPLSKSDLYTRPIASLDSIRLQQLAAGSMSTATLVALGLVFYDHAEYGRAALYFSRATAGQNPNPLNRGDVADAFLLLGNAYMYLGRFPAAYNVYREAARYKRSSALFSDLAQVALLTGHGREAAEDIDRAVALSPMDPEALFYRATFRYYTGDLHGALSDLNRVVLLAPNRPEGYMNRGVAEMDLGDLRRARVDYMKSVKLGYPSDDPYYNLGNLYVASGDLGSAARVLSEGIRRFSRSANLYALRALAEFLSGYQQAALTDSRKAMGMAPREGYVYMVRGQILGALGRHTDAARSYIQGLKYQPQYAPLYSLLGNEYAALGRVGGAARSYRQAIRLGFQVTKNYESMCELYGLQRMSKEANECVSAAAAALPPSKGAVLRAQVNYLVGRLRLARAEFLELVRVDPRDGEAWTGLGAVTLDRGHPKEAVGYLSRAVHLAPTNPVPYDVRGDAYRKLGEDERAIADYYQALVFYAGRQDASRYQSVMERLACMPNSGLVAGQAGCPKGS